MLRIRLFSPTDVRAVTKVVNDSLGEDYPPSLYLTVHNLWPEGFLVAQEGKKLVGFVAAIISGTGAARVLMLAVLPEYRGKTLGQKLMEELYTNCLRKGVHTVVLEVRKSNKAALRFYEKQGYEVSGEIKKFYSNGEDAYKLAKVLQT